MSEDSSCPEAFFVDGFVFFLGCLLTSKFWHLGVLVITETPEMNGSVSLLHQSKPSELEGFDKSSIFFLGVVFFG